MPTYQLFSAIVVVVIPGKKTHVIPKGDRRYDHIVRLINEDRIQEIAQVADLNSPYYTVLARLNGHGWVSGDSASAAE
jgi:hypothetical protein